MTYTCDVGYTLQGSKSRTCQPNGQRIRRVPQCQHALTQQIALYTRLKWIDVYYISYIDILLKGCHSLTCQMEGHALIVISAYSSHQLQWSWYSHKRPTHSLQYNLQLWRIWCMTYIGYINMAWPYSNMALCHMSIHATLEGYQSMCDCVVGR